MPANNFWFRSLLVSPLGVAASLLVRLPALAGTVPAPAPVVPLSQIASADSSSLTAQVTSVSQLSDVQPTDWAFQALQSLVERYGCIAGYPNGTFRGNRAMTRYEFAAGLNACLDKMNELIQAGDNQVRQEDLAAIQKLEDEFGPELAALRGRVDSLEARTAKLEAQQFSTTTKLTGEVIFGPADASSINGNNNQAVFQSRVRLSFNTSFTGKDLLVTRLLYSNAPLFGINAPGTGSVTGEGRLTYQEGVTPVTVDWLAYYLPLGKKAQLFLSATGSFHADYVITTANPYNDGYTGGNGSLSFWAADNSIYFIGGGTGAAFTYNFSKVIGLNLGYLAGDNTSSAAVPGNTPGIPSVTSHGNGLFNGAYSGLAQLSFQPDHGNLKIALIYMNAYATPGSSIFNAGITGDATGLVGTTLANFPGSGTVGVSTGTQTNSYALSASYQFTPHFVVSAWGDYTNARIAHPAALGLTHGTGDIWAYALSLAFPDALVKGNLAGFIVGAEPYLANSKSIIPGAGNKVPIHIEGYYKFQVNDFISVTPGIIYLVHPDQTSGPGAVIGVLRTTFTF